MNYPDIYFNPKYAKLYTTGNDEVVEFEFKNEHGFISNGCAS